MKITFVNSGSTVSCWIAFPETNLSPKYRHFKLLIGNSATIILQIVESSRRHEETLELVKQKAVELCSPRPVDSWVILADWNLPPTPDPYDFPKSCAVCKIQVAPSFHLNNFVNRNFVCEEEINGMNWFCLDTQRSNYGGSFVRR